jgi:hypothetical protein
MRLRKKVSVIGGMETDPTDAIDGVFESVRAGERECVCECVFEGV